MISRFEKEFYKECSKVLDLKYEEGSSDFIKLGSTRVNYTRFSRILKELGYIKGEDNPDEGEEKSLVLAIWDILNGKETSQVTLINIKKFLMAI